MNRTYQVIATSRDGFRNEIVRRGLTREQAHKMCMDLAKSYRSRNMQLRVYNPSR